MSDKVNVNRDLINQCFICSDDSTLILFAIALRRLYEFYDSDFLDTLVDLFVDNPGYDGSKNVVNPIKQYSSLMMLIEKFIGVD